MTKIFTNKKNEYYDDYAHHPTEISSVLKGIKDFSKKEKLFQYFNLIVTQELKIYIRNFQSVFLTLAQFYFVLFIQLEKKRTLITVKLLLPKE